MPSWLFTDWKVHSVVGWAMNFKVSSKVTIRKHFWHSNAFTVKWIQADNKSIAKWNSWCLSSVLFFSGLEKVHKIHVCFNITLLICICFFFCHFTIFKITCICKLTLGVSAKSCYPWNHELLPLNFSFTLTAVYLYDCFQNWFEKPWD